MKNRLLISDRSAYIFRSGYIPNYSDSHRLSHLYRTTVSGTIKFQNLVQMIVKKAYGMAKQMNIPVLGIVENYSYVKCPDCGKELKVFGESHIEEIAAELGVPVLGKMPIDPAIAEAVEEERFYEMENPYLKDVEL